MLYTIKGMKISMTISMCRCSHDRWGDDLGQMPPRLSYAISLQYQSNIM